MDRNRGFWRDSGRTRPRSKIFRKCVDRYLRPWDIWRTHGNNRQHKMRTKALLVAAAITVVGLATSLAQSNVYSLNVVGYHNISTTAGQFKLIANQLNTANNSIGSILTNVPHGTFFYKYNAGWGTFDYDTDLGGWDPDGNATLNPGEGGLIKTPSAITITFVGEVLP